MVLEEGLSPYIIILLKLKISLFMIVNADDAENLPLSQKQTCLNKVHEIALYVFRRMQLKMHSINHLVKKCTQVLGYF